MKTTKRTEDRVSGTGEVRTNTITTDDAAAWLRGEGDLVTAAMGRNVPVPVQLGVLAHGSIQRLTALGRYRRRGSIRRSWGTDMAMLAGEIARFAGTPEKLMALQSTVLVPLELEVLGGALHFPNRDAVVDHLRSVISLQGEFHSDSSSAAV
jgi:hypothetical protein